MPETSDWKWRVSNQTAATNADQAEFSALRYESSHLETGVFDERIADAMDDFTIPSPAPIADWAEADAQDEVAVSDIANEIQRRQSLLGEAYPFTLDGNSIVYRQSFTLAYEFCLAVSQAPDGLSKRPYNRLPIAFERLARDAAVLFLGCGAKSYRTGWPSDKWEDRPTRFKDVIQVLHDRTGEWYWNPGPGRPGNLRAKDEGLDFVAWKLMPDGRPGNLFLLGQCACGNDWASKFGDIDSSLHRLEDWIRPISAARPLRVFAVPHHIANQTEFYDANRRAGLTFDRARIALIAEKDGNREYVKDWMKDPYGELIRLVIKGFEVAAPKRKRRTRKAAGGRRSR